jgi:hypothetical protein
MGIDTMMYLKQPEQNGTFCRLNQAWSEDIALELTHTIWLKGSGSWLPPRNILAGRRLNDSMGQYVAAE